MKKENVKILAIESSCDETAVAIIEDGRKILSNVVATQIEIHKKYGGVVPEIASRHHIQLIIPVIKQALQEAELTLEDIDAVAVTYGPGLVGALLVGVSCAKALAWSLGKPLIPVNHIEGHIAANYLTFPDLKPPYLCLVVSGGHSHIVEVLDYNKFNVLGRTRDDAVGEAFDKVSRAIGLGYPGGPLVEKAALEGNEDAISFPQVSFGKDSYDFSFSGVKTAVLNYINIEQQKGNEINYNDIAASFQKAACSVLVDHTIKAAKANGYKKVVIAGGVSANRYLKNMLSNACEKEGIEFMSPKFSLCTDNAAMIGSAAYYEYINGTRGELDLNATPSLKLG